MVEITPASIRVTRWQSLISHVRPQRSSGYLDQLDSLTQAIVDKPSVAAPPSQPNSGLKPAKESQWLKES